MELTAVKNLSSGGGLKVEYKQVKTKTQMSFSFQPMFVIPNAPILLILCEPYTGGSSGGHFYRFVPNAPNITAAEQYRYYLSVNIGFYAGLSTNYEGLFCRVGDTVYCRQNVTDAELTVYLALIG